MRRAGQVTLALVALPAGAATGLASVMFHAWVWGLLLAGTATVAAVVALPRWPRLAFVVGWWIPVAAGSTARPEGDFLLDTSAGAYALLALGTAVAVATLLRLVVPARPGPPT